jgi:hypothetical protein
MMAKKELQPVTSHRCSIFERLNTVCFHVTYVAPGRQNQRPLRRLGEE